MPLGPGLPTELSGFNVACEEGFRGLRSRQAKRLHSGSSICRVFSASLNLVTRLDAWVICCDMVRMPR